MAEPLATAAPLAGHAAHECGRARVRPWPGVSALILLVCLATTRARGEPVQPPETAAGILAALPARGLAAAIAEASSIEVPAVDPSESVSIRAAQEIGRAHV